MTLLAAAASPGATTTTTTSGTTTGTTTTIMPYTVPSSAPFNAPTYMAELPTPDGSGQVVHPAVYDFGAGSLWNGWRFWMAMTPYPASDSSQENPCILVSNDGWSWYVPDGLTNPVYGTPPYGRFNSDPHLEFDPLTSELILTYREQQQDTTHQTFYARSADGVTWPYRATALDWTWTGEGPLSPCLVRRGAGDWVMYAILKNTWNMARWEATSPEGTWSGPFIIANSTINAWHLDVHWDGSKMVALVDCLAGASDGYILGTSSDGASWAFTESPVMLPRAGEWDAELYRATFTPHENGTHNRVWYSGLSQASGSNVWRTGYTELPKTLWPAPPS